VVSGSSPLRIIFAHINMRGCGTQWHDGIGGRAIQNHPLYRSVNSYRVRLVIHNVNGSDGPERGSGTRTRAVTNARSGNGTALGGGRSGVRLGVGRSRAGWGRIR
jgi:hypothetical protein